MLAQPGPANERGTVLLLFPAAMLIMVILGAITIDISLSQVRGRELDAVASSAANDALAALDIAALRNNGSIAINPSRAQTIVADSVALSELPSARVIAVDIAQASGQPPVVTVTLQLRVDFIIAPALPGNLSSTTITRTRSATVLG